MADGIPGRACPKDDCGRFFRNDLGVGVHLQRSHNNVLTTQERFRFLLGRFLTTCGFQDGWRTTDDECWEWRGLLQNTGYGLLSFMDGHLLAHRVAFELFVGPIPEGHIVMHRCDNPPCVRPSHLVEGTDGDNAHDRMTKGRPQGRQRHPDRYPVGEAVLGSKLTSDQVRTIRDRAASGDSHRSIAAAFGVSRPVISKIIRRDSWRHVA